MAERHSLESVVSGDGGDAVVRLKVVPGASRTKIAGLLGDRLKVAVAAPPEGGKANKLVCEVLAGALGVAKREVTVESGETQPRKVVRVTGLSAAEARARLADALDG